MDYCILQNISQNKVCQFYPYSIDQQISLTFHIKQILLTCNQKYLKSMPKDILNISTLIAPFYKLFSGQYLNHKIIFELLSMYHKVKTPHIILFIYPFYRYGYSLSCLIAFYKVKTTVLCKMQNISQDHYTYQILRKIHKQICVQNPVSC